MVTIHFSIEVGYYKCERKNNRRHDEIGEERFDEKVLSKRKAVLNGVYFHSLPEYKMTKDQPRKRFTERVEI